MRDLLNLLERTLTESVGLANRRPGDRWANDQGHEIIFSDLAFFPEQGAYNTPQEIAQAIQQVAQQIGVAPTQITWANQPKGALAFAIAHFVDEANKDYYIGRYLRTISPNRAENSFPNDLPGGYRLQTKSALKERTGYKPTDVLQKLDNQTPNSIYAQVVDKFGDTSDEARAMALFMGAETFPVMIPLGNMNFAAFTNYFCELLQPMALVMGKPTTGNAAEAEAKFMSEGGFAGATITFGSSKTGGLTDSTLTNAAGQSIGVSSKAKAGAKASASNLEDKVNEMSADPDGRKLLKKYASSVELLKNISSGGYINGPLDLAVEFKMITPKEKEQIKSLRKLGPQEVVGQGLLSKRLEKIYASRKGGDAAKIIPFYHMLAAIAFQVADHVNTKTDFSTAASAILNFGAFIQVYTLATQAGKDIKLPEFHVDWPSKAVTKVLLSAAKTYYSTGNKGNFTFQILKNNATPADTEVEDNETDTKPDVSVAALDQFTQQRSNVKAAPDTEKLGTEKSLGRRRQR
tara:strand:- start:48 stop:1604 length:1557 start_codon:yes stop_codon:yes gene_type:complete